jgi:small-conductance mechanosensitive channel
MMDEFLAGSHGWLRIALGAALAIAVGLAVHLIAILILRRVVARTGNPADDILLRRLSGPARLVLIVFFLSAVQPLLLLPSEFEEIWRRAAGLVMPATFGWLAVAFLGVGKDLIEARADITAANNLRARRQRTRAGLLYRVLVFLVLLATFCMMLMSFPAVRAVGVTLLASAGLIGLAVGAAAQPALKNLVSGVQMAFTEPIRIDDVVIMDGEWGRIEEIRLTFVVVRIWDDRRLIVPVSKFLENSFQNWTRETSQLLGTAFLHVDPAADVPRIRTQLEKVVKDNPNWDGRVVGLQVTETFVDHMELRALVSASDAGKAFDLRCDVREAMMAFLVSEMPEALPRRRTEFTMAETAPAQ